MLLGMRSPKVGPTPVGAWRASTSTLAQLAALATHFRTSLATMFDSTGKLTYAPNNLLTQSNTFSNAVWVKSSLNVTSGAADPFGGTNAFTLTATGVSAEIYQSVTGNTSTNYVASIWVRRRTGSGSVNLYKPNDGSFTALAPSLTSNWQQFSTVGPGGASTAILDFVIQTSGDAVDVYAATLSAVTYETSPRTADQVITTSSAYYGPRIDYDPNTLAVKGLLIEEARTNLFINSGSLSSTSTVSAVKSTDGTLAPDGVTAMTKLTASAATASHELYNTAAMSVTSGGTYTGSIFVKKGNYRYVFVTAEVSNTIGFVAVFDLDNPTTATQTWGVGTGSYSSSRIDAVGGGIYRIQVTGAIGSGTTGYLVAGFTGAATGNSTASSEPSWTAAGTEYGYFFGGQLELGSFATSYIPTAAASVTRVADVVQFTGAALTALQGSAWSFLVQMNDASSATATNSIWSGGNNSQHNATSLTVFGSGNGASYLNVTLPSGTFATAQRVGVATDGSTRTVASSGAKSTGAGGYPTALPNIYLGSFNGASYFVNGHFASFAIYNQRLPDATLQAKSVVGASY